MSTGTKTQTPVTHDEAKRIFNKLVAEKTAKGYISDRSDRFFQFHTGNDTTS